MLSLRHGFRKKIENGRFTVAVIGLAAALSLLAPATSYSASVRIALALPTLAQWRWQFDLKWIQEEVQRQGGHFIWQAAQDDERLQVSQVENMLAQGIDVLILSPMNIETSATIVRAAKEQKVPVISYNSLVQKADVDFFVARDNVAVGRLTAELAVQAAPKGNYVICSGDPGTDIAQEKTQGYMTILQPHVNRGDIKLVSQQFHKGWDPQGCLKQVEDALVKTNNKTDALLANYDGFTLAALPAFKQAGLLGKVWIGGEDVFPEAAQAIAEGNMAMSAYTDLKEMAQKAVQAAFALANGQVPTSNTLQDNGFKKVPGDSIDSFAVTKDNLCKFLKDTGWASFEKVYQNIPTDQRPRC